MQSVIASGVAGWGVKTRKRSASNLPSSRSTGAPLMPVPPMSMPRTAVMDYSPAPTDQESVRIIVQHFTSNRTSVSVHLDVRTVVQGAEVCEVRHCEKRIAEDLRIVGFLQVIQAPAVIVLQVGGRVDDATPIG